MGDGLAEGLEDNVTGYKPSRSIQGSGLYVKGLITSMPYRGLHEQGVSTQESLLKSPPRILAFCVPHQEPLPFSKFLGLDIGFVQLSMQANPDFCAASQAQFHMEYPFDHASFLLEVQPSPVSFALQAHNYGHGWRIFPAPE